MRTRREKSVITFRMLLMLAKRLARRVFTLVLFRASGLTIRTIRITLKFPVLTGMNGKSKIMIRMKTASTIFHPPSSVAEKNAGFPSGNWIVFGEIPDGFNNPYANIFAPTSVAKNESKEKSIA